ncbi:unnamed protein product [Rodentolepis nana]|uniref:Protein kinase domain-containing protein n=1 Tax=Rodentolepis nana TaxID=102285 RepID=A0A158QHD8_RODNA|nr:unnamed protein product [Rodentolepis nana]
MQTCVGLDITSTIPHYRNLLNDCQGCESGLNSVNFDETTIEQQIIQLLERTAEELGQTVNLHEQLNELSKTGSLDKPPRSVMKTGAISGESLNVPSIGARFSQAHSNPLNSYEPQMPTISKSGVGLTPPKYVPMPSTAEFPEFPITESISSLNAEIPTRLTPQTSRLSGPFNSGNYQSLRSYGGNGKGFTSSSSPYSNLHSSPGQPLKTSTPRSMPEIPEQPTPIPPIMESIAMPKIPPDSSDSEEQRPFGYQANLTFFQQREKEAMAKSQGATQLTGQPKQTLLNYLELRYGTRNLEFCLMVLDVINYNDISNKIALSADLHGTEHNGLDPLNIFHIFLASKNPKNLKNHCFELKNEHLQYLGELTTLNLISYHDTFSIFNFNFSDNGSQPYELTPTTQMPATIGIAPGTIDLNARLSSSDTSGFFKQVEQRARSNDAFQNPMKEDSVSDVLARADTLEENLSMTSVDIRGENNTNQESTCIQLCIFNFCSLTDVSDVKKPEDQPFIREIEVQMPSKQEIKRQIKTEPINFDPLKKSRRSKKNSSATRTGKKMPRNSHKKHRDYSMPPEKYFSPEESIDISSDYHQPSRPRRQISSSPTSSLSSSSSDDVVVNHPSKGMSSQKKSRGHQSIVMKPAGMDIKAGFESRRSSSSSSSSSSTSSSTTSSSTSSSSSGRGRTRKNRSLSSSSSSSTSISLSNSIDSPVKESKRPSRSPSTIIRIEPINYEAKPKKNKAMKSARRKSKSPLPPYTRRGLRAKHHPRFLTQQQNPRYQPHQPQAHKEFAYQQQKQMGQSEPIQEIVVKNCEPEFETCSHIEKGEVSNQNNCQSSVVLRHVCLKCQKNLNKGKAIVRRCSVSASPTRREIPENFRLNRSAGAPIQRVQNHPHSEIRKQGTRSQSPKYVTCRLYHLYD